MTRTKIEWASDTWNPLHARRVDDGKTGWHCEKVSSGCANCYAETFNGRRLPGGGTGLAYTKRSRELVETYLDEKVLAAPLRWRKPRRVFVCSMTDLFGEWVSDEQIDRVFAVMALASSSTFMVLTKRAERMRGYVLGADGREIRLDIPGAVLDREPFDWPLPNVWLGVSCEDQATADERIPHLLATPAAVRFVSAEPLLGPIDLMRFPPVLTNMKEAVVDTDQHGVDWVIVGGESGPGARPCNVRWVRSSVEQCREAGVAPFVKQLGARPYADQCDSTWPRGWGSHVECVLGRPAPAHETYRLRDRKGGDLSEFPSDLRVREFPR